MHRRAILVTAILVTAAIVPSRVSRAAAGERPARPNVLVILADDQGYGDVAAHGHPFLRTPALDRLHAEGVRFTDFHVAPMCTPTRSQLLTGVDAMRNGATAVCQGRSMVRREIPTIADYFREAGYATGLFGKWHLGDSVPHRPQDRGFAEAVWFRAYGLSALASNWANSGLNPAIEVDPYHDPVLAHGAEDRRCEGYVTDIVFDRAMDFMGRMQAEGRPFLVHLATPTPHRPEIPRRDWRNPYAGQPVPAGVTLPDRYYGMIANIDENVARLEAFLAARGLRDDTIVVYTSDNGTQSAEAERIYNAGMRGRKTELWDGGHRVPLFVRWPAGGIGGGRDVAELAHAQDLLPTLAELCGIAPAWRYPLDGVSLVPLMRGGRWDHAGRTIVIQYGTDGEPWNQAAALSGSWRLLAGGKLFDVATDPGQRTDVAERFPEVVARMSAAYDAWHSRAHAEFVKPRFIDVGRADEPRVTLYAGDWDGGYCDAPGQLAKADTFGTYHVEIARPGRYRLELARWPFESGLPLAAPNRPGDPDHAARPIARAAVKLDGTVLAEAKTSPADATAGFAVDLPAGHHALEGVFFDADGRPLCGAMYLRVAFASPAAEPGR
jgi:arylsulfatase